LGKNRLLLRSSVEENWCLLAIRQAGHRFFSMVLDSGRGQYHGESKCLEQKPSSWITSAIILKNKRHHPE
jgi:hypothetical protein